MPNPYKDFDAYGLRHLPVHLIACEQWDRLADVLTDLYFIEAKCAAGMTYDLIADYAAALDALPEAQEDNRITREREARVQKYIQDLIAYSKGDIQSLEIIPSVEPWTEEQIKADIERIKTNPTRLDRIRAFAQFVNAESHTLVKFAMYPGFVIQEAYNFANSGPVASAAESFVKQEHKAILLLQVPSQRPAYNPHPALIKILEGHTTDITSVSITLDGKCAVSGSRDHCLRIWNLELSTCLHKIEDLADPIYGVSITPDGKYAVSGSLDRKTEMEDEVQTLHVWDVKQGKCLKTNVTRDSTLTEFLNTLNTGGDPEACARMMGGVLTMFSTMTLSVTPDGGRVVFAGSRACNLEIWDWQQNRFLHKFTGHTAPIHCVQITGDGTKAISASQDLTLRVWNVVSGDCLCTLAGHTDLIESLSITPDGRRAVSSSRDQTLRVWDLELRACLKTFPNNARTVGITADGKWAVSGGQDQIIRVWNLENATCFRTLTGHTDTVTSVSITPDGRYAISGGLDKTIRLWDLEKGTCLNTFGQYLEVSRSSSVSDEGRTLVIGKDQQKPQSHGDVTLAERRGISQAQNCVRIWDITRGICLRTLEGQPDVSMQVQMVPGGKRAVSFGQRSQQSRQDKYPYEYFSRPTDSENQKEQNYSQNFTLWTWDVERGVRLKVLEGHTDWINDVQISPDGRFAISSSCDRTVRVWDMIHEVCLNTLTGHTDAVQSVSITPDSAWVISSSLDSTLRVWDCKDGTCIAICQTSQPITSLSTISLDGSFTGHTASVTVLRLTCRNLPIAHTAPISSPLGCYIDQPEQDIVVQGTPLENEVVLKVYPTAVTCIHLTPDGRRILSVNTEGTLSTWEIMNNSTLQTFKGIKERVEKVEIVSDGTRILFGSLNKVITAWDWANSKAPLLVWVQNNHWHIFRYLLCAFLASITELKRLKRQIQGLTYFELLYPAQKNTYINLDQNETYQIKAVTSDGRYAVFQTKEELLLWDLARSFYLWKYKTQPGDGTHVILTPDGTRIISWEYERQMYSFKVRDFHRGHVLKSLERFTRRISNIIFTPDGRRIIANTESQSLWVWDVKHGTHLRSFGGNIICERITPDGRYIVTGTEEGALLVWNFEHGECCAKYQTKYPITAISEIQANGRMACGTSTGEIILLTLRDVSLSPPIVTPQRRWLYGRTTNWFLIGLFSRGYWECQITVVCQWCGKRFPVAATMLDVIRGITRAANLTPDQSPCLELPDEAWDEPKLLSECPLCHQPLKFNPFVIDNRELIPVVPVRQHEMKREEQVRIEPKPIKKAWWRFWK